MLFSDRDFGADDYEALLALDEGIDNRKGNTLLLSPFTFPSQTTLAQQKALL